MKLTRLLILIALLLLLAACGGGEETAETQEAPADNAEAAPVDTAQEDAPEDADEVEAPAPTAEPKPTDPPPPTATAEPTEEPEPTSPPEPQASADGWGESGTVAQTACDNPYFPLRQGSTWTYADSMGGGLTWEIVEVTGDLQNAEATMQMTIPDEDFEFVYTWECSVDGGLVSYDFASQGLSQLGLEMELNIEEGTGHFLPPLDNLDPGYTWDSLFSSTFNFTTDESGEEMDVSGEMEIEQSNTVLSASPVTVNEVNAEGLQIEQVSQMLMTMMVMDQSMTNEIPMRNLLELGRGIGIVRQTSSNDFGDVTMDLVSWYVP